MMSGPDPYSESLQPGPPDYTNYPTYYSPYEPPTWLDILSETIHEAGRTAQVAEAGYPPSPIYAPVYAPSYPGANRAPIVPGVTPGYPAYPGVPGRDAAAASISVPTNLLKWGAIGAAVLALGFMLGGRRR